MSTQTAQEELIQFLSDMYSIEQQALAQLKTAPESAGDDAFASMLRQHYVETEDQANLVRDRLEAQGGSPSAVKDAIMRIGGKGFLTFARAQPETPGKLLAHAYSYEAMEWAGYQMLIRIAERAGDEETVATARAIAAEERMMMERLDSVYDQAEQASHRGMLPQDVANHLSIHVKDAHALESQSAKLLEKSEEIASSERLRELYRGHLEETREQARRLQERLAKMRSVESKVKDATPALGGINWGMFFQAQSDTPCKLAAFAYAMEHLEIAGYELLKRSAEGAQDAETIALCDEILAEERGMARRLEHAFDDAVAATVETS